MPMLRHSLTQEKLESLAASLGGTDAGQVAVAADLLARLTENAASAQLLCTAKNGETVLKRCLELAASRGSPGDVRADVLAVLKNALSVPEGRDLVCKEALLRPILEMPPHDAVPAIEGGGPPIDGNDELSGLVRQAWLGLALTAVVSTCGDVLDGPRDLTSLQDAVFELCENTRDMQNCLEGLLLLRHLYSRRPPTVALTQVEAQKLGRLIRWGLAEALQGANEPVNTQQTEAISHTLNLLAVVGQAQAFRVAFFEVTDEDLEAEQLEVSKQEAAKVTVGRLFNAMLRAGAADPNAWKAMSAIAEVKFVRRLMRVHSEVRGMFQVLLGSLGTVDVQLTEQIVMFLKHIFTGATDQFLSTDTVMFESLGRADGIKKLLTALLRSWKDNTDIAHRGNIVAFLADAMFFSSFTDTWQMHAQAKDLISILFDALLWKGVEGTAGLALGNFVSANGHIDLILDHERACHSISNVGWFLKRTPPGWDTKMQIYYLWRVLRSRKGCLLLCKHPHADLIVSGLLRSVRHATMEDNEVLSLLECFLKDEDTRHVVLRGSNVVNLLDGACELLSNGDPIDLYEPTCVMLQALMEATGPCAFLVWQGAPRLVGTLSRIAAGKDIVDQIVSMMQWEPILTRTLGLEYKREWISNQIRSNAPGDPLLLTVSRDEILKSLVDGLQNVKSLQFGLQVKFKGGDGETGAGDGHRREFFRLGATELTALELGLFVSQDGGRSLHPSPTARDAEPENLVYFELLGKLVALALMHRETLPACRFTPALRKMLLETGQLDIEDMSAVDPEFYKHKVLYLLQSRYTDGGESISLSDLDMHFEDYPQPDVFPNVRHELYPGGSQQKVTEDTKHHYIELLCDWRLRGSVAQQVDAMVRGMRKIIPDDVWGQIQRLVTPEELDLLICGLEEVDMHDWKENSVCLDGVDESTWESFWTVADGFSSDERKALLEFVTGSPGPPVGGFAALPGYGSIGNVQRFTVAPNLHSSYPVASTCFNTLYLPKHDSEAELKAALLEAVANRNAGGFYEGAVAQ